MKKIILYLCLCLICTTESCKQKEEITERNFQMGTIYWPPIEHTDSIIKKGIAYTLESSDILTAQIPWQPNNTQFLNDVKWVAFVAKQHNRKLIVNIDWQSDDRKELRSANWTFEDTNTQNKFLNDVSETCRLYSPDYLNLGVEVNFYALKNPRDFVAFVSLYNNIKSMINKKYPKIKVSVSFQLELLFGHLQNWKKNSSIEVLKAFNDNFDILSISTYPHSNTHYSRSTDLLTEIESLTQKPLGIFETSVPTKGLTESDQNEYLSKLLLYIEKSKRYELLIWTSLADTRSYDSANPWVNYLGLRRSDFSQKKAWKTWQAWYKLKLVPINLN